MRLAVSIFVCFLSLYLFFYLSTLPVSRQEVFVTESNWMDPVVEQAFAPFKEGITAKMLKDTWKRVSRNPDFRRYQVVDQQVYGPNTTILRLLKAIAKKYPLPDIDFIYYHQDIVRESFFRKSQNSTRAPIFTSAKHKNDERSVLFVDWYYDIENQGEGWNALIDRVNLSISE